MRTPRNGTAKRAAAKAVHKHERELHPGKPLTKLPGKTAGKGRRK